MQTAAFPTHQTVRITTRIFSLRLAAFWRCPKFESSCGFVSWHPPSYVIFVPNEWPISSSPLTIAKPQIVVNMMMIHSGSLYQYFCYVHRGWRKARGRTANMILCTEPHVHARHKASRKSTYRVGASKDAMAKRTAVRLSTGIAWSFLQSTGLGRRFCLHDFGVVVVDDTRRFQDMGLEVQDVKRVPVFEGLSRRRETFQNPSSWYQVK